MNDLTTDEAQKAIKGIMFYLGCNKEVACEVYNLRLNLCNQSDQAGWFADIYIEVFRSRIEDAIYWKEGDEELGQ